MLRSPLSTTKDALIHLPSIESSMPTYVVGESRLQPRVKGGMGDCHPSDGEITTTRITINTRHCIPPIGNELVPEEGFEPS